MRRALALILLAVAAFGCGPSGEPEATKEDFKKKPMPENWRGPGDGAAPTGPPSGQ